jgi:hypothetical protein
MILTEFTPPVKLHPDEEKRWINGLGAMDNGNTIVALSIIATLGMPKTAIDIGSGTGCMVNVWRSLGIEAYGIDLLPRPAWSHLLQADLCYPVRTNQVFHLVTCIEVAEHIQPESADILVNTISDLVKPQGGILIFSAAMPGQPGDGHVNCQPAEFWRSRLTNAGCSFDENLTYRVILGMRSANHPFRHIEANLQAFRK